MELRQQVEQLGTMMGRCLMMSHNSDLRYSHEYIQSQVWDERVFTRPHSRRLTEACIKKQFVYAWMYF